MLVVFLPSSKPGKKAKAAKDDVAIESMLSEKVVEAANKKARKSGETGSFLFWGAKSGSSEATSAAKRLKAKLTSSKGDKRPVLMVVYPAMVRKSTTWVNSHNFVPNACFALHSRTRWSILRGCRRLRRK